MREQLARASGPPQRVIVGRRRRNAAVAGAAALIGALVYLSTLMWQINGSDSDYAVDVGEFQVALPLWGTVHFTGYPLYTLLGSPFVVLLRWFGIAPAAGASLYSLVWAAASLAMMAVLLSRLTRRPLLSVAAALSAGLTLSVWMHGVLAEVYSLSLALTLAMLLLATRLDAAWSDRSGWLLAFLAGLGVAHHRLIGLLLPVLGAWLWSRAPRGRRLWRWSAWAVLAFLAGFLPYLDLVLRARLGATWTYGAVGTWDGFWWLFWGSEVRGLQRPLTGLPELVAAVRGVTSVLWNELRLPGLALVAVATPLAVRVPASRRAATLFIAMSAVYVAFAVLFVEAVLLAAVLIPATVGLSLTAALGLAELANRFPRLAVPLAGVLLALAAFYFAANRPRIVAITRDPAGVDYVAHLADLRAQPGATIMAPWGRRYFALSYAHRVEGRYSDWTFVDHRATFRDILATEPAIYTSADTFYHFGVDWWAQALESQPYLSAAGPGWVAISTRPLPALADHLAYVPMADEFVLTGWTIAEDSTALAVSLCWQATRPPAVDYSTFVHLATVPEITVPAQLVAQSDHLAPVDGWHPTTRWAPGEIVCDAHKIPIPPVADYDYLLAGMYSRDPAGNFQNLGTLRWQRADGRWQHLP